MKDVSPMKVITHTITHQRKKTDIDTHSIMYLAKLAGRHIESKMYTANFAGGRIETIMYPANFPAPGRGLDLLLPSFLPSREEKKKQEQKNRPLGSRGVLHTPHMDRVRIETKMQERIFCPLRGHAVGRMRYAPTTCRQETLFPINSRKERTETKIQDQKNRPLGCRAQKHTPPKHLGRDEQKIQDRIFCPLRGHSVGRMRYDPTTCRQETLFPINSREERTETKMQEQKKRPLGCRAQKHMPHIHPERDERKSQDRIFCPLRGHSVGRMRYAPTSCRQETLFPINSREERTETKMQDQKNRPLGCRGVSNTPPKHPRKDETKMQERIFCPLRGHSVGRMRYAPTTCRQETLFPINSLKERTETKMQERRKQSIDSGAEWHTPHTDCERIETKKQDRIFCPLRGHAVGRMQYAPTSYRQETLFPINSREERIETKIQDQKNRPLGSRGVLHTPPKHLGRDEKKMQDRIFYPLRGHAVGRMQYAPTSCRQEMLFPINSREERIETKIQDRIFCPFRGHAVGRMQYAPTSCRQEMLFPINSRKGRIETKIQDQKNRPLGSRGVLHTPPKHLGRDEKKMQDRIFYPLRGHAVGRMQYAPTSCRQETLFPINFREERIETKKQEQKNHPLGSRGVLHTPHTDRVRTETKMQERRKQSIDSGAEWHTLFMRQGKRDAVWRDTFLEQRARVAIWRDRRLEEKYSHARFQLSTSGENSKPYESSLVALSEQLRDIFAA